MVFEESNTLDAKGNRNKRGRGRGARGRPRGECVGQCGGCCGQWRGVLGSERGRARQLQGIPSGEPTKKIVSKEPDKLPFISMTFCDENVQVDEVLPPKKTFGNLFQRRDVSEKILLFFSGVNGRN